VTDSKTDRSYKRSWKNLLINKRYQLRFTLFMVGLTSVLMVGLGVWVMRVANETTEVSMASVRGKACPKLPLLDEDAEADDDPSVPAAPMKLDASPDGPTGDSPSPAAAPGEPAPAAPDGKPDTKPDTKIDATPGAKVDATAGAPAVPAPAPARKPGRLHGKGRRAAALAAASAAQAAAGSAAAGSAAAGSAAAGSAAAGSAADEEPRHVNVQIDESSMTLTLPPDLADQVVAHWTCELRQVGKFDRLENDRVRIQWAMIATGLLLVIGLAAYGLKMTHRVAGPLFKVSLYLTKMRAGRFDKVYNLRKGDQLVEFYDHFKLAHDGIVAMQRDDIAQLTRVIAAAEAAGAGGHPAVAELRDMLARKEKSVE
jgi:hypothetical protein